MSIVEISPIQSLEPYRDGWSDLSKNAIESNAFFEPWAFIPAWNHLSTAETKAVFVYSDDGLLIGFFPLAPVRHYRHIPIRHFGIWCHKHCFLGVPLVRKGFERETFRRFFDWIDQIGNGWGVFEFPLLYSGGTFAEALRRNLVEVGRAFDNLNSFRRAWLEPRMGADDYLEKAIKKKHRKDLEKKMEALTQLGEVELEILDPQDPAPGWTDCFMSLEGGGWKGTLGTSLASTESDRLFFREFVDEGVKNQSVIRQLMRVGGVPVCGRMSILSGASALSFKIAFNEEYSKFSPGMLLEIANLRWALDQSPPIQMDSCAAPNSEMFRRLWTDLVRLETIIVAKNTLYGRSLVGSMVTGTRLLRTLRHTNGN